METKTSNWNVENIINMCYLFCDCYQFNHDISSWNIKKVKDMVGIFENCHKFNNSINGFQ